MTAHTCPTAKWNFNGAWEQYGPTPFAMPPMLYMGAWRN